jgi:hypothetical protein
MEEKTISESEISKTQTIVDGKICTLKKTKTPNNEENFYWEAANLLEHTEIAKVPENKVIDTKKCPSCQQKINVTAKFCSYCGEDLIQDEDKLL